MTISVTHTNQTVVADDGTSPVGADEWNAGHTLSMATNRILGRLTASAGTFEELTGTQVTTMLDVFTTGGLKGLVPSSSNTGYFVLRDDATWASPGTVYKTNGSGSTVSSVSFSIATSWQTYLIRCINVNFQTAASSLNLRISTDSGSTYKSASYQYSWESINSANSWSSGGANAASSIVMGPAAGAGAGADSSFWILVDNPAAGSNYKNIWWAGTYFSGTNVESCHGSGNYTGVSSAWTNLQLFPSAGTFTITYSVTAFTSG